MANYESALTGQQMDAALTEVALYNPEAWAVGTRNGVNVTSADETWHNNAKYYAQVAQSAIPGTYTAAVRWDIAQGLAGEAQEQARANISAGASNRNLLDNPWWGSGEVVNQRAVSTFTTGAYNIDRWYFYKSATASAAALSADGVVFTYASGDMQLTQIIPANIYSRIAGKTVTLSLLLSDGTVISGTGTASASSLVTLIPRSTGFMGMIQGSNRTVYIRAYQNATIRAVKLELGSYSTLANDVPPDYEAEKRKCMADFQRISLANSYTSVVGFGVMQNAATNVRINIPTSVPFREGATLTATVYTVGQVLIVGNGQSLTATAVTARSAVKTGGVLVDVTVNGNATADQMYAMQFYTYSAYIDITANLP